MRNAIFDPVFVKEKKILLTRATEERAMRTCRNLTVRTYASRRVVPAFAEPDIHSLSRALRAVTED
jgi:hypothetical protein